MKYDPAKIAALAGRTIGERIAAARELAGLNAAQLATLIGVSRSAVSLWESETTVTLKAENAFSIETETGISARWILTGEGPKLALTVYDTHPKLKALFSAAEELSDYQLDQAIRLLRAIPERK